VKLAISIFRRLSGKTLSLPSALFSVGFTFLGLCFFGQRVSLAASAQQGLWVPHTFGIAEFQGAAILKSGFPRPLIDASANGITIDAIAFDYRNNAWLSLCDRGGVISTSAVVALTPEQLYDLSRRKSVSPAVVLDNSVYESLLCPQALQFDARGELWVQTLGMDGLPNVSEFTPEQLHTGSPLAALTISSPVFAYPADIVFDRAGNLWVSDERATTPSRFVWGGIFEFSKDQLSNGGSMTPILTILPTDSANAPRLTLQSPSGLAFDSSGSLWVAYGYGYDETNAGGVVMYSPDQLNAIGTTAPAPAITLARNNASDPRNYNIYTPTSLAFDKAGDLWVANEAPDTINEFPPDQLIGGTPPIPAIRLFSNPPTQQRPIINFFHPNLIAFGPVVEKPRLSRSR